LDLKKILKIIFLVIISIEIIALILFFAQPHFSTQNIQKAKDSSVSVLPDSCEEYVTHANQLNDSVRNYLEQSYLSGIGILKYYKEIKPKLDSGKLVLIENNRHYLLDTMYYSYPFLTVKSANLLNEIGEKFHQKLKNTHLKKTKFIVTSLLRTVSSISRLRKRNRNAIKYSSHLHGTSFDISYDEFDNPKKLSNAEFEYLKEILAQSIFELRNEEKCWATHEKWQTCFHVVSR
jgi:uncharacterized protein YifN (PemK superfamily)